MWGRLRQFGRTLKHTDCIAGLLGAAEMPEKETVEMATTVPGAGGKHAGLAS